MTDNSFVFVQFGSIDVAANGEHVSFSVQRTMSTSGCTTHFSDDGGSPSIHHNLSVRRKIPNFLIRSIRTDHLPASIVDRMYPCVYLAVDKSGMQTTWECIIWSGRQNGVNAQGTMGMDIYSASRPMKDKPGARRSCLTTRHPETPPIHLNLAVSCRRDRRGRLVRSTNHPARANTDYYMAWSFDGGTGFNNDIPRQRPRPISRSGPSIDFGIENTNGPS